MIRDFIREYLHHGQGSRKVVVHMDGRVTYTGHPDPTNRQHDQEHDAGMVRDYAALYDNIRETS